MTAPRDLDSCLHPEPSQRDLTTETDGHIRPRITPAVSITGTVVVTAILSRTEADG